MYSRRHASKTNKDESTISVFTISKLTTSTYISFLHFCLSDAPANDDDWKDMDWQGLHDFAAKQAITGVVFRGVERLGKGAGIAKEVLFNWFAESEQIKQRNTLLNAVTTAVTKRFANDGFRFCILKGQGNAMMYPDPATRNPGDIDVWLEGSRKDILSYVRSVSPNAPFQYHHVDYPPVKGVGIEVHFMPSFFSNPLQNRKMQAFFKEQADEQFRHFVQLPGCTGQVAVPTDAFNRVYQMTHIMRHLFDEGIGIRQLMDYYFLLKRGFTEEERQRTLKTLEHLGMTKFTSAVMYVLQQLFGMEDRLLLVKPDKHLGEVVLEEVFHTGMGFAKTVMRRLPHLMRYFPVETLSRPLFLAWYPLWKKRYE